MFSGKYFHNIDAKGRIIIPAKFREQLGEHFMIAEGFEGCLFVYPMDVWEELTESLAKLPSNQKSARFLQRTFFAGANDVEPDKQGKVLISQQHRDFASLSKEVVVIGVNKRVEIWDVNRWQEYSLDDEEMSVEDAAESLEGISF